MLNTHMLSVIIPITERYDPLAELHRAYKKGIEATGLPCEIIFVLDSNLPDAYQQLITLQKTEEITIISLAKGFGEAAALNAGFSHSNGDIFLTLPAYQQISADEIPRLVSAIEQADMVLARRWPREDSFLNQIQTRTFNFLLRLSTDLKIHDAGCSARAFTRNIVDEVTLYGDLHRFFPVMAHRQGFKVIELDVKQAESNKYQRIYSLGIYIRRILDLLTIFFLVKFTKKPLRFFGLIGTTLFGLGIAATLYLIGDRIFFDTALTNRPALILSTLLIVLGIQIIAIGLIGEIIIFTHAKDVKEYKVDKIIN